jgi:hypothetical protein
MKDGQTFGQWLNWDFDVNGNLAIRDKSRRLIYLYYENSNGGMNDNRTPEVIEHNGRKYQLIP